MTTSIDWNRISTVGFLDTETTGFVLKDVAPDDPKQVKLVQIGLIVTDFQGHVQAELNAIVRPNGYIIPEQVAAIHGISQERALTYGLNRSIVMMQLDAMLEKCDLLVAHNMAYDSDVLRIEAAKGGIVWEPRNLYCTMHATTDICKLPGRFGKYKWPKCTEAYAHFFGAPFEGAHDAMADVRACRDIFFSLKAINKL